MKIIAIGDIHGRDFWKEVIYEPTDQLVFIGDYFDAFEDNISAATEIENFKEIVTLKRDNPDMVTLLIGNHDYHYLTDPEGGEHYSRYQEKAAAAIAEVLEDALNLMQLCHVYKDVVFSHAGLTKTWCMNNGIDLDNLEHSVNHKFLTDPAAFGFIRGIGDDDGSDARQSPIWVRPDQLLDDKIEGFKQVVGHTRQRYHRILYDVAFIDVAGSTLLMEDVDSFDWHQEDEV
jgi:hypothetical protein